MRRNLSSNGRGYITVGIARKSALRFTKSEWDEVFEAVYFAWNRFVINRKYKNEPPSFDELNAFVDGAAFGYRLSKRNQRRVVSTKRR